MTRIDPFSRKPSRCIASALRQSAGAIQAAADLIRRALDEGGKILSFGNGGSAADAQHVAAELVNRFQVERERLPRSR